MTTRAPVIRALVAAAALALPLVGAGCYRPTTTPLTRVPLPYAHPSYWLCHPDRTDDNACLGDRSTTTLHADGTSTVTKSTAPEAAPRVDCFYVYPTVDLSLIPRLHEDFRDVRPLRDVVMAQAAGFSDVCTVYAPIYRQVTIGMYLQPSETKDEALATAFVDVAAAFESYLARVPADRKVVLLGHSQGADMVVRLLKRYFDGPSNDAMRARLVLAMPIGGWMETPIGKTTGGTLQNIPVCTKPLETGCVVAYRSHEEGAPVDPGKASLPRPGNETVCVDPITLDDRTPRRFARSVLYLDAKRVRSRMRGGPDIATPFLALDGFYGGHCESAKDHYNYLAITTTPAEGDKRTSPIDFKKSFPTKGLLAPLGLHRLDLSLPQGDLIALVARRSGRAVPLASVATSAPAPANEPAAPPPDTEGSLPPPVVPSASDTRVLRYQELTAGMLPGKLHITTWTLFLDKDGRATLETTSRQGPMNSLMDGRAKPVENLVTKERKVVTGTWVGPQSGAFDLLLDGEKALRCKPTVANALDPDALLVVARRDGDVSKVTWKPSRRTKVAAITCDRGPFAPEATWESEPQPKGLLFAVDGLEYAHDNDDMIVQHGGLRRLAPATAPQTAK